ncbi:hypothetical protein [Actinomadura sediminis]|uniref:Uncharacterized protein n=1 Tax=Actinomadura sediminis TaxID=1038904 RepID=A0ABW3EMX5_9ACTN
MNRSAKGLLRTFVFAPVLAASAVLASPASAQTGPATALLYRTAAEAAPVAYAVPEPVGSTAGQAAALGTGAVDGVLGGAQGAAPDLGAAGLRSSHRTAPGPAAGEPAAETPVRIGGPLGLFERLGKSAAHIEDSKIGELAGGRAAPAGRDAARPAPPPGKQHHAPTTEEDIVGQTNEVVTRLDRDLGLTEGKVVEVLKADDGAARGPSGTAKPPVRGLR